MSIPKIFPVNINGDLRKNTQLLMLKLTERWKQEFDNGNVVGVLFIDFKKTFDSVCYNILALKLQANGISGNLFKGELQRENKLISYERAFKMLENDMYIAGIGQAVLELLSFKVEPGNHRRRISLLQKFSDIFGNMKLVSLKMTSHLTSHNFQILKIEIFSKLCKI